MRALIRNHYDGDHFGASVLEVYTAMTEIASDEQRATFTTLQSHIAKRSCLGVTTIKKTLPELRALGVIAYQTPKLRGPITFTLLAARHLSLAATRPALAKTRFQRNLATVEECIEESEEESPEQAQSPPSPAVAGSDEMPSSASRSARGRKIPLLPSQAGLEFADWFRSTLPESFSLAESWREEWARAFDALMRIDKRAPEEIWRVSKWARADSFWVSRFLSPLKLRQRNQERVAYFDAFSAQMNGSRTRRKPSQESFI